MRLRVLRSEVGVNCHKSKMKSTLPTKLCPCCRNPLCVESDTAGRFIAWCGVGRCPSEIGDKGALGDTPELAADNLIRMMDDEMDWEPE
jgi:hypothetical protein